jgi:hypothetical protein
MGGDPHHNLKPLSILRSLPSPRCPPSNVSSALKNSEAVFFQRETPFPKLCGVMRPVLAQDVERLHQTKEILLLNWSAVFLGELRDNPKRIQTKPFLPPEIWACILAVSDIDDIIAPRFVPITIESYEISERGTIRAEYLERTLSDSEVMCVASRGAQSVNSLVHPRLIARPRFYALKTSSSNLFPPLARSRTPRN